MKKICLVIFLLSLNINVLANTKENVSFSKCIDGDTARFIIEGLEKKVRFLSIDTPEIEKDGNAAEPYGEEAKKFTITFNTDGGSTIDDQTVYEGNAIEKPVDPTKEGYTFVRWDLDGVAYDFSKTLTKNQKDKIELKAIWSEIVP